MSYGLITAFTRHLTRGLQVIGFDAAIKCLKWVPSSSRRTKTKSDFGGADPDAVIKISIAGAPPLAFKAGELVEWKYLDLPELLGGFDTVEFEIEPYVTGTLYIGGMLNIAGVHNPADGELPKLKWAGAKEAYVPKWGGP